MDYISGIRKELLRIEDNAKNINGLTASQWVAIRAAHRLLGEYIKEKVEWSEEEETIIDCAVEVVEKAGLPSLAASLESLRPHSHWKPKKEQIEALKYALGNGGKYDKEALESLCNDLQKL